MSELDKRYYFYSVNHIHTKKGEKEKILRLRDILNWSSHLNPSASSNSIWLFKTMLELDLRIVQSDSLSVFSSVNASCWSRPTWVLLTERLASISHSLYTESYTNTHTIRSLRLNTYHRTNMRSQPSSIACVRPIALLSTTLGGVSECFLEQLVGVADPLMKRKGERERACAWNSCQN